MSQTGYMGKELDEIGRELDTNARCLLLALLVFTRATWTMWKLRRTWT